MIWQAIVRYVPVNLAAIIVSFGTIAVLTRLLDGAEFGRYALAITTMHFMHMALFTWVEAAMARFYARAEQDGDLAGHLKTLYVYGVLLSVAGLFVFLGGLYFAPIETHMKTIIAFALSSTCLTLIYNLGIEAHKAAHRIGRFSALHTSQSLLGFAVGIALLMFTDLRELAPIFGIIAASLAALIIDLPFMLKRMKGGKVSKIHGKEYLYYGMPICFSLMLAYMLSQGDLFFIKNMMDPEVADLMVGQYNAGYNLANRTVDMLFVWVGMAVTPIAITALEHEGLDKAKSIMKDYGGTLMLLTMPAAIGIGLVSREAGTIILGEDVREAAISIMPWIAIAGLMNGFIAYYAQRAFMLSKNTGILALTLIPPVIVNFTLNYLWLPKYGIMGAVWATLWSYGIGIIISFVVARRYFPLPIPVKSFVLCSAACALMVGTVLALPDMDGLGAFSRLIIKALVGGTAYCLFVFATNAADCRIGVINIIAKIKQKNAEAVEA